MIVPGQYRPTWFRWYVCGLLLLATTINYMDRQTLSSAAPRIIEDFRLSNEQYGDLEMWFGYAFAFGALVFGVIADWVSVRWLYPAVLVGWSAMGIATGSMRTFAGLLACRILLGLFESGHWPCALKTTQRLMPAKDRTMGNSILQSGSSIGAIATPLIMIAMLTPETGSWRFAFQVIGFIGLGWAVLWLASMRSSDFDAPPELQETKSAAPALSALSLVRRLAVLVVVVIAINGCWHIFRVWLPLFLMKGRGYEESFALLFVSAFYVATDVGCISAGGATMLFNRLGMSVGLARWLVFALCAVLTSLGIIVAITAQGPLLLVMLLLLGAGALGLFPCYYSLSQEITKRYQGTMTGVLGMVAWLTSSPTHKLFGRLIDQYGNQAYDYGIAIAGCLPLAAALFWLLVWDWGSEVPEKQVPEK
jgi:ACS family hexuronate transporter-like MFS transporter